MFDWLCPFPQIRAKAKNLGWRCLYLQQRNENRKPDGFRFSTNHGTPEVEPQRTCRWHVRLALSLPKNSSQWRRILGRRKTKNQGKTLGFGTPEGTRTPNPRNRNPMLYPLSHWRIHLKCLYIIADKAGFVKSQMAKKSLRVRVHPERMGVTPLPGRCAHRPAASGRRCWGRPSSGPGRSCSWGR